MKFTIPNKGRLLKWLLGLLGTILLGAIGSGVWQGLLGPALHSLRNWVLDLASLGFRSYKDALYRQIAVDNSNAVNLETLFIVIVLYVIGVSALLLFFARALRTLADKNQNLHSRMLKDLGRKPAAAEEPGRSLEELETVVRKSGQRLRWTRRRFKAWAFLWMLLIVTHMVNWTRASYVDSALAHYHQALRIAAPYLESRELQEIQSRFAQIQSRQAYIEIVQRLTEVASQHQQAVPPFQPW